MLCVFRVVRREDFYMARGRKKTIKSVNEMKRANGTGCIRKLSGNRRKPYQVMITTGYERNDETGKTKQVVKQLGTYRTRDDAEEALNEYNKSSLDFETTTMTFSQIYEIWSKQKFKEVKEKTVKNYKSAYKHCKDIYNVPLKDLKTMHMQKVVDNCGHGTQTKSIIKSIMAGVFEYANMNDIVDKNYADFIKIEEYETEIERNPFKNKEIKNMWENKDDLYYRITIILIYTGMRVNELLKMKRECCDLKERSLYIHDAKNKYSERKVPIHNKIFDIIKEFYDKGHEYLISNDKNKKVVYETFRNHYIKMFEGHTIHDTRHTFESEAKKKKMDILYTQKIVGHAPDNIDGRIYMHIDFLTLLEEIQKIEY